MSHPHRDRLISALLLLAPFAWLFGVALVTPRWFLFRDSAHFYYPLFAWQAGEWGAGRVPLWNPLENCGQPAVADATSCVFYPGKLVFAIPGLSLNAKFKLFVVGHVLLAAWTARRTARGWGASRMAATLAGICYAGGGTVLFQYCNVVYLVGAAWLPCALRAADRMLAERSWTWAWRLGIVLALMTLGGDPQTAYHAGLLAALRALWSQRWANSLGLLSVAAGSGLLLSAVQVLPSVAWTRQSDRATWDAPRTLYEIPSHLARGGAAAEIATGLLAEPVRYSHHEHVYEFSVAPWRLLEVVVPNCFGRLFPGNHRWSNVIPAEDRVWTPSLYFGLLPLVLGLRSWRLRNAGEPRDAWLSWSVLLGTVGSFGWYGLGWLVREFHASLATDGAPLSIGNPVGGLYWFLASCLPGYIYFRFPAKLLTVAACGISLLAARGWDRHESESTARSLTLVATLGIVGAIATLMVRPLWSQWLADVPADDVFGPLLVNAAWNDLFVGLLQTSLVGFALAWVLRRRSAFTPVLAMLITIVDLLVANGWMIATGTPRGEVFAGRSGRVYRSSSRRWLPEAWAKTASPNRLLHNLEHERDTLFPRFSLLARRPVVESPGSLMSADYLSVLRSAKRHGEEVDDSLVEPNLQVLGMLGAEALLLPPGYEFPNPHALPRAWVVHRVERLPPLTDRRWKTLSARTDEVLFPGGRPRDFRTEAVVESAQPLSLGEADTDRVVWERDEPTRIELGVDLASPGLLVLADLWDADWEVAVETDGQARSREMLRVNRIFRGVELPAGQHRVRFVYRPRSLFLGAWISGLSWLVLFGGLGRRWIKIRWTCWPYRR